MKFQAQKLSRSKIDSQISLQLIYTYSEALIQVTKVPQKQGIAEIWVCSFTISWSIENPSSPIRTSSIAVASAWERYEIVSASFDGCSIVLAILLLLLHNPSRQQVANNGDRRNFFVYLQKHISSKRVEKMSWTISTNGVTNDTSNNNVQHTSGKNELQILHSCNPKTLLESKGTSL